MKDKNRFGHLEPATQAWVKQVMSDFDLEQHHDRLLLLAAESWDRGQQARQAIDAKGLTYEDRFGQPRSRPEIGIERDARIAFARLIRELSLDVEAPAEVRPPRRPGT